MVGDERELKSETDWPRVPVYEKRNICSFFSVHDFIVKVIAIATAIATEIAIIVVIIHLYLCN